MKQSQIEIYRYGESILRNYPDLKAQILAKEVVPYQVEIHPPPIGENVCW